MFGKKCWLIISTVLFCCLQIRILPLPIWGEDTEPEWEIIARTDDGEEYKGEWTNQNVEIIVTKRNDNLKVFYLIWEEGQEEEEGTVTLEPPEFSQEGNYKLRIWIEDEEGRRSDPEDDILKDINIDKTEPKISISYIEEDTAVEGIYFSSVRKAVLTVEEAHFLAEQVSITGPGIKAAEQDLIKKTWIHSEDGISHTAEIVLEDGCYAFELSCMDTAGNNGQLPKQEFIVDTKVPGIETLESLEDKIAWDRDMKYLAASGISGIRQIDLYKDNTFLTTIYKDDKNGLSESENIMQVSGTATVKENGSYSYQIISKSGIASDLIYGAAYSRIDRKIPEIKIEKNGYQEGQWTSEPVTLEVKNETDNLGSCVYFYHTQSSDTWTEFDGILEISEDIEDTFYFYIESEAQHRTKMEKVNLSEEVCKQAVDSVKSIIIKVDKTPPKDLVVKYNSVEVKPFNDSSAFGFYFKDTVTVTIEAKDNLSGIQGFEVVLESIDGEKTTKEFLVESTGFKTASIEFPIKSQFVGSIYVSVSDRVGNSAPQSGKKQFAALAVDKKMPTAPAINSDGYDPGQWTNQDVLLKVADAKADSGIHYYEYTTAAGEELSKSAKWISLPSDQRNEATQIEPENVLEAALLLEEDTQLTYYFRGVSNSGVKGKISSFKIKIRKSLPANGSLDIEPPNDRGWYQKTPAVKFVIPDPTPIQVDLYYKVWCLSNGEKEESVTEVLFQGTNYPDFEKEGKYLLRIWTLDKAGNRSDPKQDILKEIYIDRIKPKVIFELGFGQQKAISYYNQSLVGTITVEEMNFNSDRCNVLLSASLNGKPIAVPASGEWSTLGNKHSCLLSFAGDGDYVLSISCEDEAGNKTEEILKHFTIDTRSPEIRISGVVHGSANKEAVRPKITCSDINLDTNKTEISLAGYLGGEQIVEWRHTEEGELEMFWLNPIGEDDNYILSAVAYDKAGNSKQESIIFSVNQKGATFIFEPKDIQGSYISRPFFPAIQIWNVDYVTIVSFTINGKETAYEFKNGILTTKEEINIDGKYVITLDVIDGAGNRSSMKPVEFYFSGTKPAAHIQGVKQGDYYFGATTIRLLPEKPEDRIKEIKINGEIIGEENYIRKEDHSVEIRVSDYQKYLLEVVTEDESGNLNHETVSFEITNNWFFKLIQGIKEFFKKLISYFK